MCVFSYIQMNIFGIILLLFFLFNQKRAGNLSLDDKIFNGILLSAILEQLMDIGQWALDGVSFPGSHILQQLSYSLGYAIAPMITCLWVMYCDLRVNMDERGFRKRTPLYLLPILLNIFLLLFNIHTPLVYSIDSLNVYHRGDLFFVYMMLMYIYGIISLFMVISKAMQRTSSMERTEYRYMAMFIVPPLIGGALQWRYYGVSLIWLSVVLSIILVYTNVLSRQILTDPLTGLNNRRKLDRYLGMKINSNEADASMFLIMMDADGFKGINDRYGHTSGDRALVAIAEILKSVCLHHDCFIARLGGDEFLILGHERNDFTPENIIRKIDQQISVYNATTQEPFKIALSAGCAHFDPVDTNTVDAMLNVADQRMYAVKNAKKEHTGKATKISGLLGDINPVYL